MAWLSLKKIRPGKCQAVIFWRRLLLHGGFEIELFLDDLAGFILAELDDLRSKRNAILLVALDLDEFLRGGVAFLGELLKDLHER